jgi:tRNA dimethylallyltransferase
MNKKVIVITGPTAVGKSDIAVEVAKLYNAEIISADSSQVYKGFNIGSGKITTEEQQGIKHHLLDILSFEKDFNVALFKEFAEDKIEEIFSKGKNVVVCGGTGLYIKSLVYGYEFFNVERNQDLRQELEIVSEEQGLEKLFEMLKELNPQKASEVDKFNKIRLIRAIEIEKSPEKSKSISKPKFLYETFVLNLSRGVLYERINNRVDKMIDKGLVDEVKGLVNQGANLTHNPFKSIGYKELYSYVTKNTPSLEEAIINLKQASRNYAKRQITYFKKLPNAIWLDAKSPEQTVSQIINHLDKINNEV